MRWSVAATEQHLSYLQETTDFTYFRWIAVWLMMIRFVLMVTAACLFVQCALPPGYEEELYCPPSSCLRPKHQRPGFCGRRSMFHECCDEETGETSVPHSWGVKVDASVKADLLQRGWHTSECPFGACGRKAVLDTMVNRLTSLLLPVLYTEHASAIE